MKKQTSENMPQTEQKVYTLPGTDTMMTTALPRCEEYDLLCGERRNIPATGDYPEGFVDFCESIRPREQTFTVRKPGNCVTKGGNY